ncbi:MAG: SmpA / OmlA family, partial [Verrucomicrobiota bacterium]
MNRSDRFSLFSALVAVALLAGCAASSARLNRISPGMTREEVVSALGTPHAVTAQGGVEYLTYNLLNKGVGDMKEYAVKVVAGRVESFGEKADFGPQL